MCCLITDPDDAMRFLEVRGRLVRVQDDPSGRHYVHLGRRYGNADQQPPPDRADRVVLYMSVDNVARK